MSLSLVPECENPKPKGSSKKPFGAHNSIAEKDSSEDQSCKPKYVYNPESNLFADPFKEARK